MAEAVPTAVQEANKASVDLQIARREIAQNPHDSRTTAAADWEKKAKDSGLK